MKLTIKQIANGYILESGHFMTAEFFPTPEALGNTVIKLLEDRKKQEENFLASLLNSSSLNNKDQPNIKK